MRENSGIDVSDSILDELVSVLREDFNWDGYRLHFPRQQIASMANLVAPSKSLQVIKEDPDDDRILECALTAASDFIVTKDKHLLRLGEYDGIEIIRPVDFLQRWTGR